MVNEMKAQKEKIKAIIDFYDEESKKLFISPRYYFVPKETARRLVKSGKALILAKWKEGEIVEIVYRSWILRGKNKMGIYTYTKRWIVYARTTEEDKYKEGVHLAFTNKGQVWIKRVFVGKLPEVKKFIKDKNGGQRFLPLLKSGVSEVSFI